MVGEGGHVCKQDGHSVKTLMIAAQEVGIESNNSSLSGHLTAHFIDRNIYKITERPKHHFLQRTTLMWF